MLQQRLGSLRECYIDLTPFYDTTRHDTTIFFEYFSSNQPMKSRVARSMALLFLLTLSRCYTIDTLGHMAFAFLENFPFGYIVGSFDGPQCPEHSDIIDYHSKGPNYESNNEGQYGADAAPITCMHSADLPSRPTVFLKVARKL